MTIPFFVIANSISNGISVIKDSISFIDYAGTFATNNVTLNLLNTIIDL